MFIPQAQITIDNNDIATLKKDVTVKFDGCSYTIKKDYKSDGMSIPRFLWSLGLHPYRGKYLTPCIFHDIFYQTERYSRFASNSNLRYLLRKNNVGFIQRNVIWFFLTLFGVCAWFNHTVGSVTIARQYLVIRKCGNIKR